MPLSLFIYQSKPKNLHKISDKNFILPLEIRARVIYNSYKYTHVYALCVCVCKETDMAQAPLTTSKMFTASWTERDEAVLVELLKRKIKELKYDMRECDSPYAKAKLRSKREEYKRLLDKVERSDYDPNILAAELKTHSQYNAVERSKKEKKLGRYADAYSDVNFDFESYFNKTRYFGAAAPILSIVLILVFLVVALLPMFPISNADLNTFDSYLSFGDMRMSLSSVAYIKLGENEQDFQVANNGKWPKGTWMYEEEMLEEDELYMDANYETPDMVWLYKDLGMTSIDITTLDLVKALFRTPMFSEQRLDAVEDMEFMEQGDQASGWYYIRFMRNRADDLVIEKGEDGKYDSVKIIKHIATYGTIIFFIATIVLCVVEILLNIGRLFSYTSRRIHVVPLLILVFALLTMICPAFLEITTIEDGALGDAFKNYFTVSWDDVINLPTVTVAFNMFFAVLLVLPLITTLVPLFFKNREAKTIAYVPKGNKKHTYNGQDKPTKPGQPGDKNAHKRSKGKIAKAGSRSPSSARLPAR